MARYESIADVFDKVDWEGGIIDAILDYGIGHDELPESVPDDIVLAWAAVEGMKDTIDMLQGWLNDHADDGRDYDGL